MCVMAGESGDSLDVSLVVAYDPTKDIYNATVTVTVPDTCYHEVGLMEGKPPGTPAQPATLYLSYEFTYDKPSGHLCAEPIHNVSRTFPVKLTPGIRYAIAYSVVNDKLAGATHRVPFPRHS
jgi:hypothetical protein